MFWVTHSPWTLLKNFVDIVWLGCCYWNHTWLHWLLHQAQSHSLNIGLILAGPNDRTDFTQNASCSGHALNSCLQVSKYMIYIVPTSGKNPDAFVAGSLGVVKADWMLWVLRLLSKAVIDLQRLVRCYMQTLIWDAFLHEVHHVKLFHFHLQCGMQLC